MERIIVIICFLSSLWSCSPISDELSDDLKDDLTYHLAWSGDVERFTIDAKGLRLNDPKEAGGSAFLSTPWSQIRGARWEFRTHLFFNPSAQNYARFYLASSSSLLSGSLQGYFLQIGGSKDQVSLYRQEGLEAILLASGREVMKGQKSPELRIKVECDDRGYWTFWTCLKEEPDYVEEKRVRDTRFTRSVCAGVYCFYTATRSNGFLFSHLQLIPGGAEETTEPDEPSTPDEPKQQAEGLLFNEMMYHPARNGIEYVELYNNSDVAVSLMDLRLVKQNASGDFLKGATPLVAAGYTKVPAKGYICFTKSVKTVLTKHKDSGGVVVEIENFPSLNDKGGFLVLQTEEGKVLDRCPFNDQMHAALTPDVIGVSLEKRFTGLSSSEKVNWTSSKGVTGGTPGRENSVMKMK